MDFSSSKKRNGFTLVEIVIYLGLLAIFTTIITNLFLSESRTWLNARASRDANDAGRLIMERLIQEIRLARSVDVLESSFGMNPGKLVLETFADTTSSQASILGIFLDGDEIKIERDYGAAVPLSGSSVSVTNLVFHHMLSAQSELIRIELSVEVSRGALSSEKSFTSAAVLRGSY